MADKDIALPVSADSAPAVKADEKPARSNDGNLVTVSVDGPPLVSEFVSSDSLSIGREGVQVASDKANDLVDEAKRSGVNLRIGN